MGGSSDGISYGDVRIDGYLLGYSLCSYGKRIYAPPMVGQVVMAT